MSILIYIAVMAVVTYLIRMLPFAFFRKKIKSRFFRSFLYYIPYAVLSAMTIPAIFYTTHNIWTAVAGTAVALILAFLEMPFGGWNTASCSFSNVSSVLEMLAMATGACWSLTPVCLPVNKRELVHRSLTGKQQGNNRMFTCYPFC